MDIKFLDKARIDNDEVYTPFTSFSPHYSFFFDFPIKPLSIFSSSLSKHCKEVYSLNEQEIDYIWKEYKKGITSLMDKKEPSHQEKG